MAHRYRGAVVHASDHTVCLKKKKKKEETRVSDSERDLSMSVVALG